MNVPSTPTRRVTRGQWCCHPRSSAATYNLHPPTLAPSNLHHLPLFSPALRLIMQTVQICLSTQQTQVKYLAQVHHTLSELTNILYLLALVILTLFSLVDTITEGS